MKNSVRLLMTVGAAGAIAGGSFAVSGASADTGSPARPATERAVATTLWAKVASNGTLLAASGIGNVNHFGGGRYNLTTSVDISGCALTGTLNTTGGSDPGPGSSSILVGAVNGRTLFVRTATPSATGAKVVDDDRPFSLLITC